MTQDTSPRAERRAETKIPTYRHRHGTRGTRVEGTRIPNLYGLTARISGFLEISFPTLFFFPPFYLSLSLSPWAWEKMLNRTSDFDNCLRELGKTWGAKRRARQRETRIFRHLTPLVNDEALDATYFDRVKIEGINRSIVNEGLFVPRNYLALLASCHEPHRTLWLFQIS